MGFAVEIIYVVLSSSHICFFTGVLAGGFISNV